LLKGREKPSGIVIGNVERRKQLYNIHVMAGNLRQNPMVVEEWNDDGLGKQIFVHLVDHGPSGFQPEGPGFPEFNADHQPPLSNILDELKTGLHGLKTILQKLTHALGILH
jgi:hypothetical protein